MGDYMRGYLLCGATVLAISLIAPASVWAWSTEQASPGSGANLAEQDDPLKVLQDKVDSKSSSKQGNFYFSAGQASTPFGSPYGFQSNQTNTTVPFGYSPMPGFRGRLD